MMTFVRKMALTLGAVLRFATVSWARGMSIMRPSEMSGAVQSPGGLARRIRDHKQQPEGQLDLCADSQRDRERPEWLWLEMRAESPRDKMVMKQPVVATRKDASGAHDYAGSRPSGDGDASGHDIKDGRRRASAGASDHGQAELVGTESVTVPAGTFTAEHFRSTNHGKTGDVWPLVLVKVLDHETSQITGEPQKLNIPGISQ